MARMKSLCPPPARNSTKRESGQWQARNNIKHYKLAWPAGEGRRTLVALLQVFQRAPQSGDLVPARLDLAMLRVHPLRARRLGCLSLRQRLRAIQVLVKT